LQRGDPSQVAQVRRIQMTPERDLLEAGSHNQFESLTTAEKKTLQQAVAKVVRIAAEKSITIEKMIELLRSDLTVSELL
jgi:DNA-binding transcriptional regulator YdaS (Cro superfamily)